MGKKVISLFLIVFVLAILSLGVTLGFMNFDYRLIEKYQIFKEMATYSLESEYMKPYVREHLNAVIWNILVSVAIFMVALAISILLIIKVYQINNGKKSAQEVNEIKIDRRIYFEGKIKGLTELLYLIETHKDNVNIYGDKLIDFLEELGYPNIVVNDKNIMDFVKDFNGSATELSIFLSNMETNKDYHLIQKDTGKVVPLNMNSLIPMLNFVLNDYDKSESSVEQ